MPPRVRFRWIYLFSACKCCIAKTMHWLINSLRLMSALAALSSTCCSSSDGSRIEMTSLSGFCGIKYFILRLTS